MHKMANADIKIVELGESIVHFTDIGLGHYAGLQINHF